MNGNLYSIVIAVAALVLLRYVRTTYRPIRGSGLRILLPIIFMTPGLMLIGNPEVHSPAWMWTAALALGGLLSLPLIFTTGYEIRANGHVYAKPSVWFLVAFAAVLVIRFILRSELDGLDPQTKAALFMTVAFGYILPWRIASYVKFRKVAAARA
ncbi:CcdC protein domain-containing protein [Gorillibacterium sp. sgz5001074]|uniref:CcdC protein domain-containing protein n=1 Tax=Gorillibacterium sp. sgz5001074 TaxID=3446695 RepID=UPI003F67E9AC